MMFEVIEKGTNKIFKVYAVKEDSNGITRFLFYKNYKWEWEPADVYKPASVLDIFKFGNPNLEIKDYHGLVTSEDDYVDDGK